MREMETVIHNHNVCMPFTSYLWNLTWFNCFFFVPPVWYAIDFHCFNNVHYPIGYAWLCVYKCYLYYIFIYVQVYFGSHTTYNHITLLLSNARHQTMNDIAQHTHTQQIIYYVHIFLIELCNDKDKGSRVTRCKQNSSSLQTKIAWIVWLLATWSDLRFDCGLWVYF